MKALLAISEEDPQGEVVGIHGYIEFPDASENGFVMISVFDENRLIGFLFNREKKIREIERAIIRHMEGSR